MDTHHIDFDAPRHYPPQQPTQQPTTRPIGEGTGKALLQAIETVRNNEKAAHITDIVLGTTFSAQAQRERQEADRLGAPQYMAPDAVIKGRQSYSPGVNAAGGFHAVTGKGTKAIAAYTAASALTMPGPVFGGGADGTPLSEHNRAFVRPSGFTWTLITLLLTATIVVDVCIWNGIVCNAPEEGIFLLFWISFCGLLTTAFVWYQMCRTNRKEAQLAYAAWISLFSK